MNFYRFSFRIIPYIKKFINFIKLLLSKVLENMKKLLSLMIKEDYQKRKLNVLFIINIFDFNKNNINFNYLKKI